MSILSLGASRAHSITRKVGHAMKDVVDVVASMPDSLRRGQEAAWLMSLSDEELERLGLKREEIVERIYGK